jgi:hypothetical protein
MSEYQHDRDDQAITREDIEEVITKIEDKAQSRPIARFATIVVAVGLGTYLGVGRNTARLRKDVALIKSNFGALSEFLVAQDIVREAQTPLMDRYFGARKAS